MQRGVGPSRGFYVPFPRRSIREGPMKHPNDYAEDETYAAVIEVRVAVAWCHDCKKVLGPDLSESVGEELAFKHGTHNVELIDEWIETEGVGRDV